jgi:GPH family glycoside/pentoside/hexuronide:cation symporter
MIKPASIEHRTAEEDRVPLAQKIAVGAGAFPVQNGGSIIQYMAQPIYQITLGLNPVLFGLAMTIPRVIDAFTDPVMGAISDRYRSRYGRRRPFVFAGALAMALSFMLIWMVPKGSSGPVLFTWLTLSSIVFYLAFTVFSVPLTSLTYELTPDYHERTLVMAWWGFFGSAGSFVINWYSPAATWEGWGDALLGARWIALAVGVLVFAGLGVLPAIFGRERFYHLAAKESSKIGFKTALRQVVSSRPMLTLVGLILALNFCATIASSLAQYIVIYHVKGGDVAGGITLNALNGTGFAIIGFAMIPVISWLSARLGKRRVLFLALGLSTAGGAAKWVIFTPSQPYLLLLDAVLNGPIWITLGVLVPSMMADLCDWDELQHGERREGLLGAVFSWITKVGLSCTALFSGVAVAVSGFDAGLGAAQPAETMLLMRGLFTGASILAPLLGAVFLAFYPITEKMAHETREALEARRGRV